MIDVGRILGSWIHTPGQSDTHKISHKCAWHFIDSNTTVTEVNLDEGLMVSWFQYWPAENGILRYPLGRTTRAFFKIAEYFPLHIEDETIVINGYMFKPLIGRKIPPRWDFHPGGEKNEHGFRSPLEPPLDSPP